MLWYEITVTSVELNDISGFVTMVSANALLDSDEKVKLKLVTVLSLHFPSPALSPKLKNQTGDKFFCSL